MYQESEAIETNCMYSKPFTQKHRTVRNHQKDYAENWFTIVLWLGFPRYLHIDVHVFWIITIYSTTSVFLYGTILISIYATEEFTFEQHN